MGERSRIHLLYLHSPKSERGGKKMDANPLWVAPPDDAYAPYFEEFQSKQVPNFTVVEDLILCKAYVVVL